MIVNKQTGVIGKSGGFSLIELMVVVVIAAILLGLALPAYTSYMQKTRRTDAKVMVTTMASQQERHFLKNNGYAASTTALGYANNPQPSDEGYYNVAIVGSDCDGGGRCSGYTITATAVGAQADDTDCATLTLTETGQKSATSSDCW